MHRFWNDFSDFDLPQALYEVQGHQLERKKLRGCFLSQFPGDHTALAQKLQKAQASAAAEPPLLSALFSAAQQPDEDSELRALMERESQNLVSDWQPGTEEPTLASLANAAAQGGQMSSAVQQPASGSIDDQTSAYESMASENGLDMVLLQRGAEHLGSEHKAVPISLPKLQANLNVAAPEFRPGAFQPSPAAPEFQPRASLASAASQTLLSSAGAWSMAFSSEHCTWIVMPPD